MPRHRGDSQSSSEASDHEEEWDSESSSSSEGGGASSPRAEQEALGGGASHLGAEQEALGGGAVEDVRTSLLSASSRSFGPTPSVVSTLQLQVSSNHGDVTVYTQ